MLPAMSKSGCSGVLPSQHSGCLRTWESQEQSEGKDPSRAKHSLESPHGVPHCLLPLGNIPTRPERATEPAGSLMGPWGHSWGDPSPARTHLPSSGRSQSLIQAPAPEPWRTTAQPRARRLYRGKLKAAHPRVRKPLSRPLTMAGACVSLRFEYLKE